MPGKYKNRSNLYFLNSAYFTLKDNRHVSCFVPLFLDSNKKPGNINTNLVDKTTALLLHESRF